MTLPLAQPFVVDEIGTYIKAGASVQPNRTHTRYVVIHHAAAMYSPGQACAKIFQAHSTRPDFGNYYRIGYHEVIQIERSGQLAAHLVNPPEMQGAGVFEMNDVCYHICAASNFIALPDDGFIEALAQRAAAALTRYPDATIVGHKEITVPGHGTTCPGSLWAVWKPRLLARVAELQTPAPKVYRVAGLPVYQRQDLTGTVAGHLDSGAHVAIDATYSNGAGHLDSGLGFVDLDGLEAA